MNNQTTYNRTARYLHWGMALCYTAMFATAIAWNIDDSLKFLMNPHRGIGILLLILTLFRVIWAITHAKQSPANNLTAKLGHGALLFLVVGHIGMVVVHHAKGDKILNRMK